MTFGEGETIWTESSYKYRPDELVANLEQRVSDARQWIDGEAASR